MISSALVLSWPQCQGCRSTTSWSSSCYSSRTIRNKRPVPLGGLGAVGREGATERTSSAPIPGSWCGECPLPRRRRFFLQSAPLLHHGLCKPISAVRYPGRKLIEGLSGALRWIVRIRQDPAEGLPCKPVAQANVFHVCHFTFSSRYREGSGHA